MSTNSPPAGPRVGLQTPRICSIPAAAVHRHDGQDYIDLASSAGLVLDPWQQLVLREGLATRTDGSWAAFEVAVVVPRQCGKSLNLAALMFGTLFLADPELPPPLVIFSAHEFKTAQEQFRAMRVLLDRSPSLSRRVRSIRTANGSESIELDSGARIKFLARTGGAGRGFSADLVVFDEAFALSPEMLAATLPTLSARNNPQIWYTSSAGLPASEQLAALRARGIAGDDPGLAYFEWSAEEADDPADPETWYKANPALGIRIHEHFVAAEQRALPPEQFARERLGIWVEAGTEHPVVPPNLFDALNVGVREMDKPVFSVEVGLDRHTVLAAAWHSGGREHVEVVEDRPGTDWVVARCGELTAKYGSPLTVVDAATEAGSLVRELEMAGCRTLRVDSTQRIAACGRFQETALTARLSHAGDPALYHALANARWKDAGDGARVFSRRRSAGSIGELYAVALALHGLANSAPVDFVML